MEGDNQSKIWKQITSPKYGRREPVQNMEGDNQSKIWKEITSPKYGRIINSPKYAMI